MFKRTTASHVVQILLHVRESDVLELKAASDETVEECLWNGLRESDWVKSFIHDGNVVAIFGVYSRGMPRGTGVPWMIGSTWIDQCRYAFTKAAILVGKDFRAGYDYLFNYTDVRNQCAEKWLTKMGFRVHEPKPFGRNGELFRKFEMGECHV